MAKGGKRSGAGRPKGQVLPPARNKEHLREILEAMFWPPSPKDSPEIKQWRELWTAKDLRIRFDAMKYLYDQVYGKATQPVDHGAGDLVKVEITTNVKMRDPYDYAK